MLKDKINQLADYVIGKVIDLILVRVQEGSLDAYLSEKVDGIVTELTTPEV